MNRILRRACVLFIAFGLAVHACSVEGDYIGDRCGVDDADCHTEINNIPGSFCRDHVCTCPDGQAKCCPGGAFTPEGNPIGCVWPDDYRCRTWDECHPQPVCETAPEVCPQAPDLRCGKATCEDGQCGIEIFFPGGAIDWQALGDCKKAYCASSGQVVYKEDSTDLPKTADPCVVDSCQDTVPVHEPIGQGEPCIGKVGFCLSVQTASGSALQCRDCRIGAQDCAAGTHCLQNFCVSLSCGNGTYDGGESDIDCGGKSCVPCKPGRYCLSGADCEDGVCKEGVCVAPAYDDGVKNGAEAGIDCGCTKCFKLCLDGDGCASASHCESGVCYGGKCQAPTCFDMVQNGTEQDIDCGEGCPLACPVQSSSG